MTFYFKMDVYKLQAVLFNWYPPKNSKYKKVNQARLGVSRTIYVAVDSPNLGFPYFHFLGGYQLKETPCII